MSKVNRHTLEYHVAGLDAASVEKTATEIAVNYFGGPVVLVITTHAEVYEMGSTPPVGFTAEVQAQRENGTKNER